MLLPAAPTPAAASPTSYNPIWRGEGTVVVIDDEPAVGAVIGKMLRSLGFTPVVTANAREGLSQFAEKINETRLIMLDLTLAHLDGAQTFRQTLGIHPQVPVLLVSSLDEHETRQRIRGLGVAGHLTKPFKPETLRDTLQKILP